MGSIVAFHSHSRPCSQQLASLEVAWPCFREAELYFVGELSHLNPAGGEHGFSLMNFELTVSYLLPLWPVWPPFPCCTWQQTQSFRTYGWVIIQRLEHTEIRLKDH